MNSVKKDLIKIIRLAVHEKSGLSSLKDVDWTEIWKRAQRNHLEGIVYDVAKTCSSSVPKELLEAMQRKHYEMVARDAKQIRCLEQIEEALKGKGVPYAPQKGSILRHDYPRTNLRFMSDLDICVRPEDRALIRDAIETVGGVFRGTESGDEQFLIQGTIGVEFHGRLLYRKGSDGAIENYPCWELVDSAKNRLTEEGFALNLIGHAVYDLSKGGPGVRYILDLWVYRHRHMPQPDRNVVDEWLKKDGIYEAAHNLLDLSEYLFGEGAERETILADPSRHALMTEMADYILDGGLHGDARRGAAAQVARAGGKSGAAAKQFFRNRKDYENRYPWLKKAPFLLPLAWGMRACKSLKTHGDVIRKWRKDVRSLSKEEVRAQKDRMKRWGV